MNEQIGAFCSAQGAAPPIRAGLQLGQANAGYWCAADLPLMPVAFTAGADSGNNVGFDNMPHPEFVRPKECKCCHLKAGSFKLFANRCV